MRRPWAPPSEGSPGILPKANEGSPGILPDLVSGPTGIDTDAFVAAQAKKRKPTFRARDVLAKLEQDVIEMKTTGFAAAEPKHFVALYYHLHSVVYGVHPTDLERKPPYMLAVTSAKRLLAEHFGGDPSRFALWMRWVWSREAHRFAKKTLEQKQGSVRITWRAMFVSRYLLDDYRAASAAQAKAKETTRAAT